MKKFAVIAYSKLIDGESGVYTIGICDNFVSAEVLLINALNDEYDDTEGDVYGGKVDHVNGTSSGRYENSIGNELEIIIEEKVVQRSASRFVMFQGRAYPIYCINVNGDVKICSTTKLQEALLNNGKYNDTIDRDIVYYFSEEEIENCSLEELQEIIKLKVL